MALPNTHEIQEFAKDLYEGIRRLLTAPSTEFPRLAAEPQSLQDLFLRWILPLTGLMVLANTLRALLFGIPAPGGAAFHPAFSEIPYLAAPLWLEALLMPFASGIIIMFVSRFFGGTSDYRQATRTAAFISTPGWLLNIFGNGWTLHTEGFTFNPSPGLLLFGGAAWGLYLLWRALPDMLKVPQAKTILTTGLIGVALAVLWAVAFVVTYGMITSWMHASSEAYD